MRVALYIRVSTNDQTTLNQRQELEVWAASRGFKIVATYEDVGISGSKGRDKRPGFDAMLKAATRHEFDLLAAWSVDRLGRSLQHLVSALGDLTGAGVGLYLHKQAVDTTTPSGRAMLQMLGVFAEFEREMIRDRVVSGIARARKAGKTKSGKAFGRPLNRSGSKARAIEALQNGASVREAARASGASVGTVGNLRKQLELRAAA